MKGLVLQGGGMRGSYQVGAFLALKKCHIKIKGVCGTSIGALNGAFIASGKERELLDIWENLDLSKVLGFSKEYIEKKQNNEYDLKYLKLKLENTFKVLKSGGISLEGIEDILDKYLDDSLFKSKIDYGLCTVRLPDFKPYYIFKRDMDPTKLKEYILASCALPLFKREKIIDNHYYLDGGFYDNVPVNMLIDAGYKKIYEVYLNPLINVSKKPKKNVKIIKISPKKSLGFVVNYDLDKVKENIKLGYYDTLKVIKKLDGNDYYFKKRGEFFYKWLVRKVPDSKLKRIKVFLRAKTNKEIVLKSLEYVLKNEGIDCYKIYKPYKMIKYIKKNKQKKHFVYEFIQKLQIL